MAESLSEQFRIVAKKWVEADSAAYMPVSRAETIVKASDEWSDFIAKMIEARKHASLLKVQLEYIRMRFSEQQSIEATARAERRL
jgi:hypothetical protein